MSLYVAVVSELRAAPVVHEVPWGAWALHPVSERDSVALDPVVRSGQITQLLVLAPERLAADAHIMGSVVASTRSDLSVRVEVLAYPVLSFTRVLEQLAGMSEGPNAVYAALMAGLADSTWGAWLPSVSALSSPAPTILMHVQSWLPGGLGFLALGGARGWVSKLPLGDAQANRSLRAVRDSAPVDSEQPSGAYASTRPSEGGRGPLDAVASGELSEAAIGALFALGLERRPQRREPVDATKGLWGHDKAIEFVITPSDARGAGAPTATCPACSQAVWGRFCPFCRVTTYANVTSASPAHGVAQ